MKHWKIFSQSPVVKTLSNGMEVHYIVEPTHVTYIELDIAFGSYHLTYLKDSKYHQTIPGIAHFLEHKIFAMEEGDAFKKLSALGVSANAMTTYRQTSYTLSGVIGMMDAIKYLLKVIDTPYFTEENIESEKKIIIEEIQMYDNDPDTKIYQDLYKNMLHQHPLLHDIAGSKENVASITKEHLLQIYRDFYHPKNRRLIILGPIDVDSFHQELERYIETLPLWNHHQIDIPTIHEPSQLIKQTDTNLYPISRPKLVIGVKHQVDSSAEKLLVKNEISTLFLFQMMIGNNSLLCERLIDEGLINDQFNMQITMEDETLIMTLDNHTDDTMKLTDIFMDQFFNHSDDFITEEAFDLLKRAYLGSYIMALDDVENRLFLYGKYQMNQLSLEEAIDTLNQLSLSDVWNLYRKIKHENISILHAIPIHD